MKANKKSNDDVILISDNEIRILKINQLNEESIQAGELTLPKCDSEIKYYPSGGRAFIYGWSGNYLAESEAITELEKSVAIKQMFNYSDNSKVPNIQFIIMAVLLFITILLLRG